MKSSLILAESYFINSDFHNELMFNPYRDIMREIINDDEFFTYKLPITGQDIMTELNIQPGPDVKEKLDHAYRIAFQEPDVTREQILMKLSEANNQ